MYRKEEKEYIIPNGIVLSLRSDIKRLLELHMKGTSLSYEKLAITQKEDTNRVVVSFNVIDSANKKIKPARLEMTDGDEILKYFWISGEEEDKNRVCKVLKEYKQSYLFLPREGKKFSLRKKDRHILGKAEEDLYVSTPYTNEYVMRYLSK